MCTRIYHWHYHPLLNAIGTLQGTHAQPCKYCLQHVSTYLLTAWLEPLSTQHTTRPPRGGCAPCCL